MKSLIISSVPLSEPDNLITRFAGFAVRPITLLPVFGLAIFLRLEEQPAWMASCSRPGSSAQINQWASTRARENLRTKSAGRTNQINT